MAHISYPTVFHHILPEEILLFECAHLRGRDCVESGVTLRSSDVKLNHSSRVKQAWKKATYT